MKKGKTLVEGMRKIRIHNAKSTKEKTSSATHQEWGGRFIKTEADCLSKAKDIALAKCAYTETKPNPPPDAPASTKNQLKEKAIAHSDFDYKRAQNQYLNVLDKRDYSNQCEPRYALSVASGTGGGWKCRACGYVNQPDASDSRLLSLEVPQNILLVNFKIQLSPVLYFRDTSLGDFT